MVCPYRLLLNPLSIMVMNHVWRGHTIWQQNKFVIWSSVRNLFGNGFKIRLSLWSMLLVKLILLIYSPKRWRMRLTFATSMTHPCAHWHHSNKTRCLPSTTSNRWRHLTLWTYLHSHQVWHCLQLSLALFSCLFLSSFQSLHNVPSLVQVRTSYISPALTVT